ncbi:putative tubulin/FtsZ [Rosa chinensis]|uniref:Putative tubulin/FtsZ n=1 Tax=Rosa chinensis TaxID=74649 RepID=A0A2P6RBV7_ROSCH|nr:putative tubulin/FtsZ [Rosa chinensis]
MESYGKSLKIPGLVNVDFADVRVIMANAGSSLVEIGSATGRKNKMTGVLCELAIRCGICTKYLLRGLKG